MPRPSAPAPAVALALALALAGPVLAPPAHAAEGTAGPYLAARLAGEEGDFAVAADYFQRALARDPLNPALLENALQALVSLGDFDLALPVARALAGAGLKSQLAALVILVDAALRRDFAAVAAATGASGEVGPLVDALVTAWSAIGAGRMSEALATLDDLAGRPGMAGFAAYHRALALASVGDFEGAADLLSGEAAGPLRLTRRGVIGYAQVLAQLDRRDDALALLEQAFEGGGDPLVDALRDDLAAGRPVPFTLVRDAVDGLAEVFYSVALVLQDEAEDGFTLLYCRTAEALRPDHADAVLLSARLLDGLGQPALAIAAYGSIPTDSLSFPAAEIGRAEALYRMGKTAEAEAALTALALARADLVGAEVALGDLLRRESRFDDAARAYDRAVALVPAPAERHWSLFYARGISHEREKRWELAEADFLKALELHPDQPDVLNYLGYSWVEMGRNLDRALAMIERAVAAEPDSGYIVDSLAWALYRLGRYREAGEHMERAVLLMPTDPILNDHLGDIYWAVGRRLEAGYQWRRALQFEPEEAAVPRIRRKLEVGLDRVLEEEGAPPLATPDGTL
ncbi:MAG: tetratricopeptide repeat protein [Rhodobacteraceae bacterium]|nr:tetratricopeptide repeat protein [Paracoccaceae bacterium]